jgi:hypothetical protein
VPAHGILGTIFDTYLQVTHGLGLAALAKAVRELVLEKGGRGDEGCGNRFEGRNRLVCGRGLAGEVFEGEEGAEAGGEGGGFGCESVAEGEDGGVGRGWGVED